MSGNDYSYYHPHSSGSYPSDSIPQWSPLPYEQQYAQSYGRPNPAYHATANHSGYSSSSARSQNFHSPTNTMRHFPQHMRYNASNQFGQRQNWSRSQTTFKRPRLDATETVESKTKSTKKRKKPLSQNIPSKKDWNLEEASKALAVEKEYNKRHRNHSLIIKFPDHELKKDMVFKFHPSIENVHFQQPSTPRFCFVTLEETTDTEEVISVLNKQKFGDGYLTAEYKKDREEDQNVGPDDIDPLTLYVGNLSQEITKDDIVKTYPKGRRIDIGYAKKMKYTRYAFVTFRNVNDAIEAFKKTHSTQMHSKSLIVRFRRLHGTVGMSGEAKPQNPAKDKMNDSQNETTDTENNTTPDIFSDSINSLNDENTLNQARCSELSSPDISVGRIKQEPSSPPESDSDSEMKPFIKSEYVSPFSPGPLEQHKPKIRVVVKEEVKLEQEDVLNNLNDVNVISMENIPTNTTETRANLKTEERDVPIKNEPIDEDDAAFYNNDDSNESEQDISSSVTDFGSLYQSMVNHAQQIDSLKNARF